MSCPTNVWEDKVGRCLGNSPGTLVAYRSVMDGRVDMEFVDNIGEGGWLYVYDAYNDGNLSGPGDKAFIAEIKRVDSNWKVKSFENITRLAADNDFDYFEAHYRREKERVIRDHIRDVLLPARTDVADDQFTADEFGNITGFKDRTLSIDDASYPEGMQMIRDAVGISHMLNESAKSYGVYRPWFDFDLSLCCGYSRGCEDIEEDINLILWSQVEDYIDYLTHPCPEDESKQLEMLRSVLKTAPEALK